MNKKRQLILLGFIFTSEMSFAFDFGGFINSIVSPVTQTIGDIAGGAVRNVASIVEKVAPACTPCGNGDATVRCLQVIEAPGQDTVIKTGAHYSGRVRRCLKAAIPPVCGPSQDDLQKARQFCQSQGQILDVDAVNKYEKSVVDNALKLGTATINQVATSASAIGAAGIGAYKGDANVVKAAVEASGDEKRKNDFHKLELKEAKKQLKTVSEKNAEPGRLSEHKVEVEPKNASEDAKKQSQTIIKEDKSHLQKENEKEIDSKEALEHSQKQSRNAKKENRVQDKEVEEISRLKLELEKTKKQLQNVSEKNAEQERLLEDKLEVEHKNVSEHAQKHSQNKDKEEDKTSDLKSSDKKWSTQSEVRKGSESQEAEIKELDRDKKHVSEVNLKKDPVHDLKEKDLQKDSKLLPLHQQGSAIKKGASQEFRLKETKETDDENFEKSFDKSSGQSDHEKKNRRKSRK